MPKSLVRFWRKLTRPPTIPGSRIERRALIDQDGCTACGGRSFSARSVVPDHLAASWALDKRELAWLEGREGHFCEICGLSRRVRMLLWTVQRLYPDLEGLDILHINQINGLAPYLEYGNVVETIYDPDRTETEAAVGVPVHQDIEALTFPDDSFDLVIHSETLEHVFDYNRALAEIRRVLRPGGRQIYTVPLLPGRRTHQRMKQEDDGTTHHLDSPSFHGLEGEYPVIWELGGEYFRERAPWVEALDYDEEAANPMVFSLVEGVDVLQR